MVLVVIAVVLAVLGIVGSVVPALPGPPISWVAMLCAYFCKGTDGAGDPMSLTCLIVWLVITIAITVIDYVVPAYLVKVTGGHREASIGATLGMIAGIIFTPIGMILGSLLGAFIGEMIFAKSDTGTSIKAAAGAFLGFITGTFMKLAVSVAMAWYVFIYIA